MEDGPVDRLLPQLQEVLLLNKQKERRITTKGETKNKLEFYTILVRSFYF
jgi:hypothetical protein